MLTLTQMIVLTAADKGATWNKKIFKKIATVATTTNVVVTVIDGETETENLTVEIGDFIVTGPKGEQYAVPAVKFNKLYKHVEGNVYETLADSVKAVEVNEELSFESPWGGEMIAHIGDYIVYRNDSDAYRVEREIFLDTYEVA